MTLLWIMLTPLCGAVLVGLLRNAPNLRESVSVLSGLALLGQIMFLFQQMQQGHSFSLLLAEPIAGMPISLTPEPLGLLFAGLVSFLWPVTTLYAIGYMRGHHEQNQTRFYLFFALSICAALGIALSANLLTLFLFYELLTLATYPLVTHSGTAEARHSGRIYLGILMGSSIAFFLLALLITAAVSGQLSFNAEGLYPEDINPWLLNGLLILFVLGTAKAATMPLHRWLPNAMVAPVPVSALLHAVAVVKAGAFTLLKLVIFVFGAAQVSELFSADLLAYLAGFTILAASIIAMRQDNIKARLAYSTIGQLAYITLGAMLATPAALEGATFQMVAHAVGKITLFFCAGALVLGCHKTRVSELNGLGVKQPLTFALFTIGALSIIGLPPLVGAWSKWWLLLGTVESGHLVLAIVLMVSSILNLIYLLELPVRAFFKPRPEGVDNQITEAPAIALLATSITALLCILLFFYADSLFMFIEVATQPSVTLEAKP